MAAPPQTPPRVGEVSLDESLYDHYNRLVASISHKGPKSLGTGTTYTALAVIYWYVPNETGEGGKWHYSYGVGQNNSLEGGGDGAKVPPSVSNPSLQDYGYNPPENKNSNCKNGSAEKNAIHIAQNQIPDEYKAQLRPDQVCVAVDLVKNDGTQGKGACCYDCAKRLVEAGVYCNGIKRTDGIDCQRFFETAVRNIVSLHKPQQMVSFKPPPDTVDWAALIKSQGAAPPASTTTLPPPAVTKSGGTTQQPQPQSARGSSQDARHELVLAVQQHLVADEVKDCPITYEEIRNVIHRYDFKGSMLNIQGWGGLSKDGKETLERAIIRVALLERICPLLQTKIKGNCPSQKSVKRATTNLQPAQLAVLYKWLQGRGKSSVTMEDLNKKIEELTKKKDIKLSAQGEKKENHEPPQPPPPPVPSDPVSSQLDHLTKPVVEKQPLPPESPPLPPPAKASSDTGTTHATLTEQIKSPVWREVIKITLKEACHDDKDKQEEVDQKVGELYLRAKETGKPPTLSEIQIMITTEATELKMQESKPEGLRPIEAEHETPRLSM